MDVRSVVGCCDADVDASDDMTDSANDPLSLSGESGGRLGIVAGSIVLCVIMGKSAADFIIPMDV